MRRDVESAARRGRLRAEKGPGRHDYLIPEEEVRRFVEERIATRSSPTSSASALPSWRPLYREAVPGRALSFCGGSVAGACGGWRNPWTRIGLGLIDG